MTDGMVKFNHRMTAEESISSFIKYLEETNIVSDKNKEWLFKKGYEIFDIYYIDEVVSVGLASQKDKDKLLSYLDKVQNTLGNMFAHIMLIEFKLHILTED